MVRSVRTAFGRPRASWAAAAVLVIAASISLVRTAAGAGRLELLRGEVLAGLGHARDLGPVSPGKRILVAVTVQKDLRALYRAESAMYDPKSTSYHRFLTPSQFARRFDTSPEQLAAIRQFATSHGMRLVNPKILHDYVEVSGTVRQAESTFHVTINAFRSASGLGFFANLQNPRVPAGLGIDAVLGLENFDRFHLADLQGHSTAGSPPLSAAQTKALSAVSYGDPSTPVSTSGSSAGAQGGCQTDPTGQLGSICTGLLSPQALWKAYNMPGGTINSISADSSTDFGQGQTMAIIGEGQTADVIAALREFEKTRGLPQVPVQVYHTDPGASGAESSLDDSGRIEWELDTQASTGMAPGVQQVRMYFGSSLALTELTGAISTWVNDPQAPLQASASLGACEDNPALHTLLGAAQRADMALLAQAAMEGRTLFASTGDTGAGCSLAVSENGIQYGPIPTTEYPSVDPNAVGVGGTILYTKADGTYEFERAWDHTGGGPSHFIAQPSYQTNASPFLEANACATDSGGNPYGTPGQLCRGVSDVSAESGDITISLDHKVGDVAGSGYNPTTQPVQANGYDMSDFCPASEHAAENPAQAQCAYAGSGGTSTTVPTDSGPQSGVMTDHFSEGGTSLASPLWLGMWTRIQAHHDAVDPQTLTPDQTKSLGFANYLIYKLAQASSKDFNDITVGGNPLPAAPGWDFPSGWGSPQLTNLIEDASGTPSSSAPVYGSIPNSGTDPAPLVAVPQSGPSCSYAFFDPSSDAPDLNGSQDDQLDLVQGTLGLTSDGSALRVVLNLKNLSTAIPTGSTYLDYEFFWNNPSGDSGPNAVDAQVDSSGAVTYSYGTETLSNGVYQYTSAGTTNGTFGSGKLGTVEVDVPLSTLKLKTGDVLGAPSAYTADGNPALGNIVDQDGPGASYTVGEPTCIDSGTYVTNTSSTTSTSTSTTSSSTSSSTTTTGTAAGNNGSNGSSGSSSSQSTSGQSSPGTSQSTTSSSQPVTIFHRARKVKRHTARRHKRHRAKRRRGAKR